MTLKINFSQVQTFSYSRPSLHSKDPDKRAQSEIGNGHPVEDACILRLTV